MNAPLSAHPTPPYKHTPLFPLGADRNDLPQNLRGGRRRSSASWARRFWSSRVRRCVRWRKRPSPTSIISCVPPISPASRRSSRIRRRRITTSSSPTTSSRTPISPPAACCRCARTPAPRSSWARRAGSFGPMAATRRRSPRARAMPISSAICAIRSSRRFPCSRRRTRARTCRRRSRFTPRAPANMTPPTNFCSSPKAAARRTNRFCSRRRRRSCRASALPPSSRRRC